MDLVHNTASDDAEKDRITELPDDIILRILSFLDMKYAVQTSLLSRRWKHVWKSISNIILSTQNYNNRSKFAKFVKEALSHRNNRTKISELELKFAGIWYPEESLIKHIVNYVYFLNVRKVTIIWSIGHNNSELPQDLFSSPTLKHLTLDNRSKFRMNLAKQQTLLANSAWDFPVLETLSLSNLCIDFRGYRNVNMFSKCKNLKDLVLDRLEYRPLETFDIWGPQLINLTITDSNSFPKVFNVVAPQLKNLTASVSAWGTPGHVLPLTVECFNFLEKVNLSFGTGPKKKTHGSQILDLFAIIRNAKILILDVYIIERLSTCMDRILHEPSPFIDLKCLKINMVAFKKCERIATILVQVNNYLLQNSRSARTFIVDFPQLLQKRPRQAVHNDKTANKASKLDKGKKQVITALEKETLEEKIKMQNQIISNQKAMFDRLKLQHDNLMSRMVECKMVELQMLIESKSSDNDVIRKVCFDMKSAMDMIPESLRVNVKANFSSMFQGLKTLFLTRIDATQWVNIEAEFGFMKNDVAASSSLT